MLTRVREVEGGYRVTLLNLDGDVAYRETANLAEAFAWQAAGGFPDEVSAEPEPVKTRGRRK